MAWHSGLFPGLLLHLTPCVATARLARAHLAPQAHRPSLVEQVDVELGQQVPTHAGPQPPASRDVPPGTAGASAASATAGRLCETERVSSPSCILYYIYGIILYLLDYIILYYIIRAVRASTSRLELSAHSCLGNLSPSSWTMNGAAGTVSHVTVALETLLRAQRVAARVTKPQSEPECSVTASPGTGRHSGMSLPWGQSEWAAWGRQGLVTGGAAGETAWVRGG